MKNQALFSLNDKSKKLKCCLLQFLFGALRVKEAHLDLCYLLLLVFNPLYTGGFSHCYMLDKSSCHFRGV